MKKSIQLVAIILFLLGKTTSAQENQIAEFGTPFKTANIAAGFTFQSITNPNDYTVVLIDRGQLNPTNNVLPLNCFKLVFVDLLSKKVQVVEIKDVLGNTVTTAIGDPFCSIMAADGNAYIGTQGGGHLICVNFRQRTATDLGKPINFEGLPNITTLSMGTDLALYGIINNTSGTNQGAYSFRYSYNNVFSEKDNTVIDANRTRAKQIGADNNYTYVRCEANDYVLYAINKITKQKSLIQLTYNGTNLDPAKPFEIATYAGDYVYARISTNSGAYYWRLYNGSIYDNQDPTLPNWDVRKRVDLIFESFTKGNQEVTSVYDANNNQLNYQIGGTTGYVNLSDNVQKYSRPTGALTSYFNAAKNRNELFVHGLKYSLAASVAFENNNELSNLGSNPTQSVYSVTADFDNTKVLIGSYSNGTIQSFNSQNSWNIFSSIQAPCPTAANANPVIKYQVQNPLNSINNEAGIITVNAIKKINGLQLYVAGGNRKRNNPPYYQEEMGLSIINAVNNQIKNIYIAEFQDYYFSSVDIDQTTNKIIAVGIRRENPAQYAAKLFVFNANGELQGTPQALAYNNNPLVGETKIEVAGSTVYAYCGNMLFRINNYSNANTSMELMYNLAGTGAFKTIKLFSLNNKQYVAASYLSVIENGYKMAFMPATVTNNVAPGFDNDVIKINGKINLEDGIAPYEMVNTNGKIFLSGFATIYGFTPAVAAAIPNGGGVANNNNQKSIAISPNPARDQVNINYTASANETVQVQVYSNDGLMIYNKQVNAVTGKNNIPLNISGYATGNFVVRVAGKEKMNTARFIKE